MIEDKILLKNLANKYWHEHQSYKLCVLSANGVGHDLIHPLDRLQGACRNAWNVMQSIEHYKEEIELKEIEINELAEDPTPKNKVMCRRKYREKEMAEVALESRETAFRAHMDTAKAMYDLVKSKYPDYDSGLEEIWSARVAYNVQVKNHPLGQELKIAVMSEAQKQELLHQMDFPSEIAGPDGQVHQLPAPNADAVMKALFKHKELGHG